MHEEPYPGGTSLLDQVQDEMQKAWTMSDFGLARKVDGGTDRRPTPRERLELHERVMLALVESVYLLAERLDDAESS